MIINIHLMLGRFKGRIHSYRFFVLSHIWYSYVVYCCAVNYWLSPITFSSSSSFSSLPSLSTGQLHQWLVVPSLLRCMCPCTGAPGTRTWWPVHGTGVTIHLFFLLVPAWQQINLWYVANSKLLVCIFFCKTEVFCTCDIVLFAGLLIILLLCVIWVSSSPHSTHTSTQGNH